ncbi:MAG TPA: hypothetical protein VHO50_01750 [Bacteroidales bacterium]|nr:hypothetical protein [Bacteroidales bacterium]
MKDIYQVILVTVPSLLVMLTSWLVIRSMLKNDQDRRRQELILQNSKTVMPIRLQAYERMILFLERISLESMLVRVSTPDMTATQLHSTLLSTIRSEFEHNLSQQIYMTQQSWEVARNARSNMIKMINTEYEKLPPNAGGMVLSKQLLEKVMEMEKEPTRTAIEYIKAEIARVM